MKKIISICTLVLGLYLAGCVMTPDGQVGVVTGADVNIDPHIVLKSKSGVTVRIGPSYTIDDAFPLANKHCRRHGYYAVATKEWARSYNHPRNLAYKCKKRGPAFVPPGHRKHKHKKHHKHWD